MSRVTASLLAPRSCVCYRLKTASHVCLMCHVSQPQDSLFFDAPASAVVIYSNDLVIKPLGAGADEQEEAEDAAEEGEDE